MEDEALYLALQQSYIQMAGMQAFQELLQAMDAWAAEAESEVLAISPDASTLEYRTRFIKWQQRKELPKLVRQQVQHAVDFVKRTAEETRDERNSGSNLTEQQRGTYQSWN